ncbi:hypothetical protein B9Z19DRAFT_1089804 [Tuber borchii]|uniref:Transmembrane protein n=1 Tax=Tuber borchii TaxID=42251 RepID=A0A2T6ZJM7_TUBBO|nr:hypothetical protein B9Z19DRAFT_1089804 [Tuber borchii]
MFWGRWRGGRLVRSEQWSREGFGCLFFSGFLVLLSFFFFSFFPFSPYSTLLLVARWFSFFFFFPPSACDVLFPFPHFFPFFLHFLLPLVLFRPSPSFGLL